METEDLQILDVPERARFEIRSGRRLVGWTAYQRTAELVVFTHTEVDEAWAGQGIGGRLVRATLDRIRQEGLRVLPVCSFVRSWMTAHPGYDDLLYRPTPSHVAD